MNFAEEYGQINVAYQDYLGEVERLIQRLIDQESIQLAFPISGRLKKLDSIIEKHESGRFKIKKTTTELEDLVGLRIVVLFPENKDIIINTLKRELKCIKERNFDSEVDKFAYSSTHLVLKIPEGWKGVPPWNEHTEKRIEVQIRTLSEHIWAETSHTLFYKGEENIPKAIKRDLHRLSALLEIADDKLQNVKDKVLEHFKKVRTASYEEILKMDLNPETLKRVFSKYFPAASDEQEKTFQLLNRQIERDFDIHNVEYLDTIIKEDFGEFSGSKFEEFVDFILKSINRKIKLDKD